ncbi:MAG: hypothetical protein ACRDUY_12370 [Nitriliruptorales bacterium]
MAGRSILLLALGALLVVAVACTPGAVAEGGDGSQPALHASDQRLDARDGTSGTGRTEPAATSSAYGPTSAAAPQDPAAAARRGERPSPADTSGSPLPAPEPTTGGPLGIVLTIEPRCVSPGSAMAITIDTEPSSGVSMGIAFSDGWAHGAMNVATTDMSGRYLWRVAVAPEVPPGPATVLVGGSSEDGERGGWARDRFDVAGDEGCP